MSKVLTFSRVFPSYHPRAGQPTYFVEKIWNGTGWHYSDYCRRQGMPMDSWDFKVEDKKHHTIRAGHRWKVGDKFSPRVWSGKPYASKQITISPDIQVKQIWDFERDEDGCLWIVSDTDNENPEVLEQLAKNDGLTLTDLQDWFNKPFVGQIICWNENVEY